MLPDVTFTVTAFERPRALAKCLDSIARFYPKAEVIVVDNSEKAELIPERAKQGLKLRYVNLPFDSGVTVCRNEAMDLATTKYVMVLEDDFEFTAETRIERMREILETRPDIGIVAGALIYDGPSRRELVSKLDIHRAGGRYEVIPINVRNYEQIDGTRFCQADYVFNFFLMRRDLGIRWDPELKTGIEHVDFFLRFKEMGTSKTVFTPDVVALHHQGRPSAKYTKYRRRLKYWKMFFEKTGFRHGINRYDLSVMNHEGKVRMSYPEYVFKLMAALNKERMAVTPRVKYQPPSEEAKNGRPNCDLG